MDIENLNCLIALADYLSFTKAAAMLHISQPALSRMVSSLEEEIGFALFKRSKRSVMLTRAGREFLIYAKKTLDIYNRAVQKAGSTAVGERGVLKIGVLGYSAFGFFPQLIDRYRSAYPEVKLQMQDGLQADIVEAMRSGWLDIAFLSGNARTALQDYDQLILADDEICLVVHEDSPLAACDEVNLAALKDETFLMLTRNTSFIGPLDFQENILLKACATHGFSPNIHHVDTLLNIPLLVGCRMGIAILAESMKHYAPPNVRFVRIAGQRLFLNTIAAYKDEQDKPCLRAFLELLRQFCKEQGIDS